MADLRRPHPEEDVKDSLIADTSDRQIPVTLHPCEYCRSYHLRRMTPLMTDLLKLPPGHKSTQPDC